MDEDLQRDDARAVTTNKGNARIQEILEAGKNILVERGFSELTFRSIAARVGIKVGNVTYYFPTREHLIDALAIYIFDRWDAGFRRRTPEHLTDKMEMFEYSIRYMIEENKRSRTNALLQEIVRRQGFWDNWRGELTEALAHQGCHIRLPLLDEASGAA